LAREASGSGEKRGHADGGNGGLLGRRPHPQKGASLCLHGACIAASWALGRLSGPGAALGDESEATATDGFPDRAPIVMTPVQGPGMGGSRSPDSYRPCPRKGATEALEDWIGGPMNPHWPLDARMGVFESMGRVSLHSGFRFQVPDSISMPNIGPPCPAVDNMTVTRILHVYSHPSSGVISLGVLFCFTIRSRQATTGWEGGSSVPSFERPACLGGASPGEEGRTAWWSAGRWILQGCQGRGASASWTNRGSIRASRGRLDAACGVEMQEQKQQRHREPWGPVTAGQSIRPPLPVPAQLCRFFRVCDGMDGRDERDGMDGTAGESSLFCSPAPLEFSNFRRVKSNRENVVVGSRSSPL
jgi:hypothetical protein